MSSTNRYEEAVRMLDELNSNATMINKFKGLSVLAQSEMMKQRIVPGTVSCLERLGISVADLDALNVIHVTGTKGKGSTCAYTEAILRSLGLKTGLFSSPHMVHVRERIRIDGQPLSEEKFADSLFSVHKRLEKILPTDPEEPLMPAYFKFLTVIAYEVFLREKVDVAIVEVGIGGEYDPTNAFRSPVACGIATLDIDHVALLGNNLEQIAWNKAGIFKLDAIAVVSSGQTPEATAVISERAVERKVASLSTAPPLSAYVFPGGASPRVGIDGEHQKTNLALALQLARAWLRKERPQLEKQLWADEKTPWCPGTAFVVPPVWAEAIGHCQLSGRSQILKRGTRRFFLDGAHTVKSMESCVEWFRAVSSAVNEEKKEVDGKRKTTLIFHCTGDRVPETLMNSLKSVSFSRVLLCPPVVMKRPSTATSQPPDDQTKQSIACEAAWRRLRPDMDASRIRRFECVSDALEELLQGGQEEEDVLVTGSLILVGSVLSALGSN